MWKLLKNQSPQQVNVFNSQQWFKILKERSHLHFQRVEKLKLLNGPCGWVVFSAKCGVVLPFLSFRYWFNGLISLPYHSSLTIKYLSSVSEISLYKNVSVYLNAFWYLNRESSTSGLMLWHPENKLIGSFDLQSSPKMGFCEIQMFRERTKRRRETINLIILQSLFHFVFQLLR